MVVRTARWLRRNGWVVFADAMGIALLISLLATAGSAASLKPALLVLLTVVPLTGLLVMLLPEPRPVRQRTVAPVRRRTIYISPRPSDQRR